MVRARNVRRRPYDVMEARRRNVTITAYGKIQVRVLLDVPMVYARAFVYPRRSNATATCRKNAMALVRGNRARLVQVIRRCALMEPASNVHPTICVAKERSFKRAMRMACGN